MVGELWGDLAGARAVSGLQPLADVAVQPGATGGRQPVVNDLSLQIVNNSDNTKVPIGGVLRQLPTPN